MLALIESGLPWEFRDSILAAARTCRNLGPQRAIIWRYRHEAQSIPENRGRKGFRNTALVRRARILLGTPAFRADSRFGHPEHERGRDFLPAGKKLNTR
jgi:hypothetical protein